MSTKEQVINLIEILPDELIKSLYDYAQFLAHQNEYTPNAETLEAIKEVEEMKKNPHLYKSYNSFNEILQELDNEV